MILTYFLRKCKFNIISFDMFDTLINRDTELPEDIFCKIENILEEDGYKENFCEKRIFAEKEAKKVLEKEEITLDDIYGFYSEGSISINTLKKLEIDTEISSAFANKEMFELYNYFLKKGKQIIITTDMYLPRTVIETILVKCGYADYSKIYISGECNCSKRTGRLFDIIRMEYGTDIFHIGDNVKTDFLSAKKSKINAFWIPFPEIERKYSRLVRKCQQRIKK